MFFSCVQQCMSRYIEMWRVGAICICYYGSTLAEFYIYEYLDKKNIYDV